MILFCFGSLLCLLSSVSALPGEVDSQWNANIFFSDLLLPINEMTAQIFSGRYFLAAVTNTTTLVSFSGNSGADEIIGRVAADEIYGSQSDPMIPTNIFAIGSRQGAVLGYGNGTGFFLNSIRFSGPSFAEIAFDPSTRISEPLNTGGRIGGCHVLTTDESIICVGSEDTDTINERITAYRVWPYSVSTLNSSSLDNTPGVQASGRDITRYRNGEFLVAFQEIDQVNNFGFFGAVRILTTGQQISGSRVREAATDQVAGLYDEPFRLAKDPVSELVVIVGGFQCGGASQCRGWKICGIDPTLRVFKAGFGGAPSGCRTYHGTSGLGTEARGVHFQPDGKFLVAGMRAGTFMTVGRFMADGTPDTSYGVNGFRSVSFASATTRFWVGASVLDRRSRLVVFAVADQSFVGKRFLADPMASECFLGIECRCIGTTCVTYEDTVINNRVNVTGTTNVVQSINLTSTATLDLQTAGASVQALGNAVIEGSTLIVSVSSTASTTVLTSPAVEGTFQAVVINGEAPPCPQSVVYSGLSVVIDLGACATPPTSSSPGSTTSPSAPLSDGAIVGIALGAVAVATLAVLATVLLMRHRRAARTNMINEKLRDEEFEAFKTQM